MLKTLQLIGIVTSTCLLFITCGTPNNSNDIILSGSKITIDLPANYLAYEVADLDSLMSSSDSYVAQIGISAIKSMLAQDKNMLLYLDSNDYLNYITMTTGPKLQLNAKTTEKLNEVMKENLTMAASMYDGKVITKDLAVKNGVNHRYMKVKYKFTILNGSFFQTYYYVNGIKGTYGFSVVGITDNDMEDIISSIKIK